MSKYSRISIIYNPNSTGDSEAMAKDLRRELRASKLDMKIECLPTKRAGHGRELTAKIASAEKQPLIISSSGDGGYNEVVNGVMDVGHTKAICAVIPAGNANDHSRTMQNKPLAGQIIKGRVTQLDLVKVTVVSRKETIVRYAHSYAGLGLTPVVATELNKYTLNAFREIVLAVKTFAKYRPFKIRHNNKVLRLDSLLFGNINQMAKVLTLASKNRPDDGKIEVVMFPAKHKRDLIKKLIRASASNLNPSKRIKTYKFTVIKKMLMQLDGEVMTLPPGSHVTVESAHKALKTII